MSSLTRKRLLLGLAVLMMMVPTFLYLAGPLREPPMFRGDRLVVLDRTQKLPDGETRKLGPRQYIIPGPNRPIYTQVTLKAERSGKPVAGARVHVVGSEGAFDLVSSQGGEFALRVPPGKYTLTIRAHDFGTATTVVRVHYSKQPIPAGSELPMHQVHTTITLQRVLDSGP